MGIRLMQNLVHVLHPSHGSLTSRLLPRTGGIFFLAFAGLPILFTPGVCCAGSSCSPRVGALRPIHSSTLMGTAMFHRARRQGCAIFGWSLNVLCVTSSLKNFRRELLALAG